MSSQDNNNNNNNNNTPSLEELLKQQEEQAGKVRAFKKSGAKKEDIDVEVKKLLAIKEQVTKLKESTNEKVVDIRTPLNEMLISRFFYCPSFELYGGVAGLYDFGPAGAALKKNLLDFWRNYFVINDGILELEASAITPIKVFEVSGHLGKFCDWMVKDTKSGVCYRADHLVEQSIDVLLKKEKNKDKISELENIKNQIETLSPEEIDSVITKYQIKAPETKNELSKCEKFNLMFPSQIGPTGKEQAFLRPETAQGMFLNFKRLLEYNHNKLPFGSSQIGSAYRNEIKPQQGLLRVREFCLAEIEYFVDPNNKAHPKFHLVQDIKVALFSRKEQTSSRKVEHIPIGEAVNTGLVASESLAYYIVKTYIWLRDIGIDMSRVRFRQHLPGEMAHYAVDCWDAEIHTSYGWIECVGLADRSCYDLNVHGKATKNVLGVFQAYDKPQTVEKLVLQPQKPVIGKTFNKDAKIVNDFLEETSLDQNSLEELKKTLDVQGKYIIKLQGKELELLPSMVSFKKQTKKETGYTMTPAVIEPAFGVGRIMYALLEHSFYTRENDVQRSVLRLPAPIAPIKVSILPLLAQQAMNDYVPKIGQLLNSEFISFKADESGVAIGRRYARTDQLGVPFAITIDHTTLEDQTITLRERDSTKQVRVPIADLLELLVNLIKGKITWSLVQDKYPSVEVKED